MKLTIEPEAKEWLTQKGRDTITIGLLISRAGGCCGGTTFTESTIDYSKPKEKEEYYMLMEQDGLKIYIARIMEKKATDLRLALRGKLIKKLALHGYEEECSLSRA